MKNLNVSIRYVLCSAHKYIRSKAQIPILFILALLLFLHLVFFNGSVSQKKIVKVIDNDIHNKLLEILKGSKKFVLAKFCCNFDKKIWRLISNKDFKAKDKFSIVTGQTKFRLVG